MSDRRSTPSRRRVLTGLALLVGAGALGAGFWLRSLARPSRSTRERAEGVFLSFFPRQGKIRPLGQLYLQAHPEEADRRWLLERLLTDLGRDTRLEEVPGVRARVHELVREDFAAGRTLRLGGWVLSRTEGRLAALVALAAGPVAGS